MSSSQCPARSLPKSAASSLSDVPSPSSLEEAAQHSQQPQPNQSIPLATERQVSSIPRVPDSELPHHQPPPTPTTTTASSDSTTTNHHWMYPSQQQFYNALLRKQHHVDIASIPTVLQIHNTVNEQAWQLLLEYYHPPNTTATTGNNCHHINQTSPSSSTVQLKSLHGRPDAWSFKSLVKHFLLGQQRFDRHDWYVVQVVNDEEEEEQEDRDSQHHHHHHNNTTTTSPRPQRYVIDFYAAANTSPSAPPSVQIDVRPALDSWHALPLYAHYYANLLLPGIYQRILKMNHHNKNNSDNKRQ